MKTPVFFCLVYFSLALNVFTQASVTEDSFDQNDLYHLAARAVFEKRLSEYGSISHQDLTKITVYKTFDSIRLPKKIGEFEIEYLNLNELVKMYRKHSKKSKKSDRDSIPIMEIFPMINKAGKIEIRFADRWFSSKGRSINFALEGGSIVTFAYDCEKEKFVLENVELWGI